LSVRERLEARGDGVLQRDVVRRRRDAAKAEDLVRERIQRVELPAWLDDGVDAGSPRGGGRIGRLDGRGRAVEAEHVVVLV
jgi:hypothetical protein